MSTKVKSSSKHTISHRKAKVECDDMPDARMLFTLPELDGTDDAVIEAVHKAVRKHGLVRRAKVVDSGKKVSASINAKALRRSRATYSGLRRQLGESIINTMLHEIKVANERRDLKVGHTNADKGRTTGYVHDKTRTMPNVPVQSPA